MGGAGARGGRAGGRGRGAAAEPLEFPLALKAGPKLIGVAFVQRTEARDEATLRPRMRSRGTQPAITSVTISGPYKVTGTGDAPSRRRVLVCRPSSAAEELPCARRILSTLARRAYRRPATETDIRDLLPFHTLVILREALNLPSTILIRSFRSLRISIRHLLSFYPLIILIRGLLPFYSLITPVLIWPFNSCVITILNICILLPACYPVICPVNTSLPVRFKISWSTGTTTINIRFINRDLIISCNCTARSL